MEIIKTANEFIERVKNKQSVSRFNFKLGFKWDVENSKLLVEAVKQILADLRSANLSSANLSFADLSFADLRSADLRSADLRSADLSFADLRSADLRSANLSSANLSSADLRSADLRSAKGKFIFNFGVKLEVSK